MACSLSLAGCGHRPVPKLDPIAPKAPEIVHVPVAVSCVPGDFPLKPNYTDTREALKAAPTMDARDDLLKGNWLVRDAWMDAAGKILKICRDKGAPP
jgi:hypothetical protein